jgi:hypothetical protein
MRASASILFALFLISISTKAYSLGTGRRISLNDMTVSEFVKLSIKDVFAITGIKPSFIRSTSLRLIKMNMKKAAKQNPDLLLRDYYRQQKLNQFVRIAGWVIGGLLVLLLIVALIFSGSGPSR